MTLLEEYPLPWTVDGDEGDWFIKSAAGRDVLYAPNFTGDGAWVDLSYEQAKELCGMVNRATSHQ